MREAEEEESVICSQQKGYEKKGEEERTLICPATGLGRLIFWC